MPFRTMSFLAIEGTNVALFFCVVRLGGFFQVVWVAARLVQACMVKMSSFKRPAQSFINQTMEKVLYSANTYLPISIVNISRPFPASRIQCRWFAEDQSLKNRVYRVSSHICRIPNMGLIAQVGIK